MSAERIAEIEAEMVEIRTRQTLLGVEWQKLKGAELNDCMEVLFTDGITLEKVMSLDWDELGNRGYGSDWYDFCAAFLNEQVHGVFNKETKENGGPMPLQGLWQNGCQERFKDSTTLQVRFQIMMRTWMPIEDQLGLLVVLPLAVARDGWKTFSIFDTDMSRHFLRVSLCGKQAEVWHSDDFQYKRKPQFKSKGENAVMEALTYVHTNVPYERYDPDIERDTEDDDDCHCW